MDIALGAAIVLVAVAIIASAARGGHEVPVYPSYYPHEIAIETMPPDRAASLLQDSKIQAYVDSEPRFSGEVPSSIRYVEALGSLVVVRLNPASPLVQEPASACAVVDMIVRSLADREGFIFHPYPVTPLHGDYLVYADLALAAKARYAKMAGESATPRHLRVKADGRLAGLVAAEWTTEAPDWDAAIEAADAAALVASAMTSLNGWLGPPWVKTGWFHADKILAEAIDDPGAAGSADTARERLQAGDYRGVVERMNLQRALMAALTQGCRKRVAGYTVKRQYFSAEFTEGIENIGFDSIAGFNSPMFMRTVKLKNFPWNGWLSLGIDADAKAAWNPIGGFTDRFGRLVWGAVGDPALLQAPYDSGWMLNRVADVQSSAVR
ncbi:MAG: hypothetical protein HYR63_19830 [Proteobacteria bacterium]|nr:hypothetical protein [Pseudomonadota bacterium]